VLDDDDDDSKAVFISNISIHPSSSSIISQIISHTYLILRPSARVESTAPHTSSSLASGQKRCGIFKGQISFNSTSRRGAAVSHEFFIFYFLFLKKPFSISIVLNKAQRSRPSLN
jgi:hypothetical protein